MKILYIGNHEQKTGNDDEGAITYALNQLGHDVQRLRETNARQFEKVEDRELVLFHKWDNIAVLQRMRALGLKCIFWYFDLVEWPDETLKKRNANRRDWMTRTIPNVDLGFCTDGDWVNKDTSGKLIRLTQGADSRIMGLGNPAHSTPALLFTGTPNGGVQRQSFVDEMQINYRQTFNCTQNVHREELRNLIAASKICLAPDSPVTDHYWSNRVYNTLGFAGFLLHPYCSTLAEQYTDGDEIIYYNNRDELHKAINYYYHHQEDAKRIAQKGFYKTANEHTYIHRCNQLMATIQQRLF